ncbi:unnamed protein product [Cylindrotheca closterium]|uniref:Uncharacterized protein n=1 Tax=Cylindrotheca closterium TaxID=2856 RepID=A0AAD2CCT1_9STRA|nr:unnamed protein product [Cylindrotheca closterium]
MISAIEWVPEGVADPNPKKYEFSAAELELIEMMEKHSMEHPNEQTTTTPTPEPKKETKKTTKKKVELPKVEHDLPADLRMDEYSSDEDENDAVQGTTIGRLLVDTTGIDEVDDAEAIMGKNDGKNNDDDDNDDDDDMDSDSDDDLHDIPDTREYTPLDMAGVNSLGISHTPSSYMDLNANDDDEDDASDIEDVQIQPGDALIVVAKTEEDFATLEVNVYEQKTGNLFVHHDITLPAFPLCLAHGDIGPSGTAGNFCAVGTFGPGIEIWNLDVLNALEPSCVLGGEDTTMADEIMRHNLMNASKKNDTRLDIPSKPGLKEGSHTDAIMSLSWNKVHRQVIASGSADCTVKLWDVTKPDTNAGTFTHHKDKVQSVLWHPQEGTLLATGSYDKTVALVDARGPQGDVKRIKIPADCEALAWDPCNPQCLTVASEDGTVACWDVRKFSEKTPLWSMVANEYGGVSDISYNQLVPGLMVSCSVDKTVTLWDTQNLSNSKPHPCGSKDMAVGKLYTVNFYPSSPWLLGCAGGGKELALWDLTREAPIQKRFGDRVTGGTVYNTLEETTAKQEAFDAMMTKAKETNTTSETDETTPMKKKNKKKKPGSGKKKKAHRAGR